MAQMTLTQDLDLCRKILLRTEEVLACDGPKAPPTSNSQGTEVTKLATMSRPCITKGSLKQGYRPKG